MIGGHFLSGFLSPSLTFKKEILQGSRRFSFWVYSPNATHSTSSNVLCVRDGQEGPMTSRVSPTRTGFRLCHAPNFHREPITQVINPFSNQFLQKLYSPISKLTGAACCILTEQFYPVRDQLLLAGVCTGAGANSVPNILVRYSLFNSLLTHISAGRSTIHQPWKRSNSGYQPVSILYHTVERP